MIVRPETDGDFDAIREVNIVAFQGHPYSRQTEHLIVEHCGRPTLWSCRSSPSSTVRFWAISHSLVRTSAVRPRVGSCLGRWRSGRPAKARGSDAHW